MSQPNDSKDSHYRTEEESDCGETTFADMSARGSKKMTKQQSKHRPSPAHRSSHGRSSPSTVSLPEDWEFIVHIGSLPYRTPAQEIMDLIRKKAKVNPSDHRFPKDADLANGYNCGVCFVKAKNAQEVIAIVEGVDGLYWKGKHGDEERWLTAQPMTNTYNRFLNVQQQSHISLLIEKNRRKKQRHQEEIQKAREKLDQGRQASVRNVNHFLPISPEEDEETEAEQEGEGEEGQEQEEDQEAGAQQEDEWPALGGQQAQQGEKADEDEQEEKKGEIEVQQNDDEQISQAAQEILSPFQQQHDDEQNSQATLAFAKTALAPATNDIQRTNEKMEVLVQQITVMQQQMQQMLQMMQEQQSAKAEEEKKQKIGEPKDMPSPKGHNFIELMVGHSGLWFDYQKRSGVDKSADYFHSLCSWIGKYGLAPYQADMSTIGLQPQSAWKTWHDSV